MSKKIKDFNNKKLLIKKIFNYEFKNENLLIESITHKSISGSNYERLEFLGDSVLQLIITESLYEKHFKLDEGALSREKQSLVSRKSLAKLSIDLGIDELLESTNLNLNSTKSLKISISANLIESIIGAIFIDSNYRNCKKIVTKLFYNLLNKKEMIGKKDSKTLLQEYMQSKKLPIPKYKTIRLESPSHSPKFRIICKVSVIKKEQSCISSTVQDGQQRVSRLILEKLVSEK